MQNYFPKPKSISITIFHPTKQFWYFKDLNKWMELNQDNSHLSFSSHYHGKCGSKKALIRKLRNWNLPKGSKIYAELSNDYMLKLSVY